MDNSETTTDWNRLHNFKDVQRFLGLIQYLAHFLPDITSYTGPLASMTTNGTPFYWKASTREMLPDDKSNML